MAGDRRKSLRNYLLRGCFLASMMGLTAIIAFFIGAMQITAAHLKAIFWPIFVVLIIDGIVQFYANEKLLKNLFEWLDLNEDESESPSMELTMEAQAEILKFPLLGGAVSMGLWVFSGIVGVAAIGLTSDVFGNSHLLLMLVSILSGGLVSVLFQFYFYKVIFHREVNDLFGVNAGLFDQQDKWIKIKFSYKLMVGFLVLITVALLFASIMAKSRAVLGLLNRQAQLMKPIALDVVEMRNDNGSKVDIDKYLGRVSSYLGQDLFVFDNDGEVLYGRSSSNITSERLKNYLSEFEKYSTKILRMGSSFKSGNLPNSSDNFVWIPVDDKTSMGCVFTASAADTVLSNYNTAFVILVVFYIIVAAWVARLAANDVSGPLEAVGKLAEDVSTGDLSGKAAVLSEDEIADLARGLGAMINGLRGLIARVGRAAEQVDHASDDIFNSQKEVSEGANRQAREVEESTLAARNMEGVVSDVAENVEVMAVNSEQSAKVIYEIEELSKDVGDNISELNTSIESTTSAIYEMNATIGEINNSVEALSGGSEETAASMLQMDRAIKEVEERTKLTLDITENVSSEAMEGVNSVQSTIEGIGKIEEGVREATEVINRLGGLTEEIGEIVAVITDIADQTNLLALNAAIIAAQAGERGRGFAVVAQEVKKLSDRTTASTKKIRDLIVAVQTEAQSAVSLMDRESQSVEEGVNLAFQAGQALEKIQRSAHNSVEMMRMIAKATEEQASNSKRVTKSVESIAERVALIAGAINDQARGAEQITTAAGEMKEIAPIVHTKAQKQVESGKQVTAAMENIGEMVSYVQKSQERQLEQAGKIVGAMDQIKSVCQMNVDAVSKLDDTLTALRQQSGLLKEEIKRFRLPQEEIELDFDDI